MLLVTLPNKGSPLGRTPNLGVNIGQTIWTSFVIGCASNTAGSIANCRRESRLLKKVEALVTNLHQKDKKEWSVAENIKNNVASYV
jgi:hypothetical protein